MRHLWAVVDAVGGASGSVRRQPGRVVPDSHREFDAAAIKLNDTIYDSQRAYHAGQTVLLNVDTGKWVLLDPGQLCNVGRKYWMTDRRLVDALRKGKPPPWHVMRGSQYRLELRVVPRRSHSAGRWRNMSSASGGRALGERARRAVEVLARDAMKGWGCQKESIRDCSFNDAIQRNCARHLRVRVQSADEEEVALVVTMGEMGGTCARATHALQRALESSLVDATTGGRHAMVASMEPPPTRRRLLSIGGSRRPGRGHAAGKHSGGSAAALPASARSILAALARSGPVVVAPDCVSYCRPTSHFECPQSGPSYNEAVRRAAMMRASELGLGSSGPWNASLAILTFVYAASLEAEMTATLEQLGGERSYGHGADLIVVGATWASVMRTKQIALHSTAVQLSWDDGLSRSWRAAMHACAAAGRCILRTVPETPRQTTRQVYVDFMRHVGQLATAEKAFVTDSFSGTWSGMQAGLMAHHDSTRIHFSDTDL